MYTIAYASESSVGCPH